MLAILMEFFHCDEENASAVMQRIIDYWTDY